MERTRVIIADDEAIVRMDLREMLTNMGYLVVGEVGDGQSAVNLARELKPDLVTLDIVMPEMDGVEALRAIRQEHPDAHVVMISAIDQRAKLSECIQLGAIDFVVKPFDKQRLQSLFQTYLHAGR